MVKQKKTVRDAGGSPKLPAVVISIHKKDFAPLNGRELRRAALRMLSEVETEGEPGTGSAKGGGGSVDNGAVTPGSYANGEGSKEFLSTGRTGRRNAMPDILGHHADTGTADLSTRLEKLTTETEHDQPGSSGLGQGGASTSQQQMS